MENSIMPTFAFFRRRDIELEIGLLLAGNLVVDIPKGTKKPTGKQQRLINKIVQRLTVGARSGEMPDDAIVYGWPNNRPHPNADAIVDDHALIVRWAETRIRIAVRVDPHNDGKVRIDSETAHYLWLLKSH